MRRLRGDSIFVKVDGMKGPGYKARLFALSASAVSLWQTWERLMAAVRLGLSGGRQPAGPKVPGQSSGEAQMEKVAWGLSSLSSTPAQHPNQC
jgi:hypothetical protein